MRSDFGVVSFVCALAATLSPALAAQQCSQPDLHSLVSQLKTIQSQLLAYKISDGMGEEDPPPLQSQIRAFKDAFAVLGDAALQCSSVAIDAKSLEWELARLLDANKPVVEEVYDPKRPEQLDHIYGDDLNVKVTRPSNRPELLLLDFRFGIECGFDSLLLGYEHDKGRWKRVLRWQSKDYDAIGEAFGDIFDYLALPQKGTSDWLIAVAHGHPWCSSNFSGFDLDFIRPAQGDAPQTVLFHKEVTYWRDDPVKMKLTPDGLEMRVSAVSYDPEIGRRIGIYRYRISDNQIDRIQPIALNGRDFVDEWLKSPWNESKNWSLSSALSDLEATRKSLEVQEYPNTKDPPLTNYGPVRGCSDSSTHYQVELDAEWVDSKGKTTQGPSTYFQIAEGTNSFTMLSASEKPDPHCTGHDIMPAQ